MNILFIGVRSRGYLQVNPQFEHGLQHLQAGNLWNQKHGTIQCFTWRFFRFRTKQAVRPIALKALKKLSLAYSWYSSSDDKPLKQFMNQIPRDLSLIAWTPSADHHSNDGHGGHAPALMIFWGNRSTKVVPELLFSANSIVPPWLSII